MRGRSALQESWMMRMDTILWIAAATPSSLTLAVRKRNHHKSHWVKWIIVYMFAQGWSLIYHFIFSRLSPAPIRKIRIGGSRLLQIKGARSFRVKKGGSLSSIRRAGSLKSTKMSRQDSESENDAESERLLSQSRDTVTDIGQTVLLQPYMNLFCLDFMYLRALMLNL